jgi:hypothetical protein
MQFHIYLMRKENEDAGDGGYPVVYKRATPHTRGMYYGAAMSKTPDAISFIYVGQAITDVSELQSVVPHWFRVVPVGPDSIISC